MSTRAAGLFIITAMAAGWMLGSKTTQDAIDSAARSGPRGPRPIGTSITAPLTQRLQERRKEPPSPARGRNPFTFGARPRPSASPTFAPTPTPEAPRGPVPVPAPQPPQLRLSGIAVSNEGGAAVRTAIVIDGGTMVFVKAGDTLSDGRRVVTVDEMSITLVDAAGVTETLRLP
jgi:hypothetical protein